MIKIASVGFLKLTEYGTVIVSCDIMIYGFAIKTTIIRI